MPLMMRSDLRFPTGAPRRSPSKKASDIANGRIDAKCFEQLRILSTTFSCLNSR